MCKFNVGYLLNEYRIHRPEDYDSLSPRTKMMFCRRVFRCLEKDTNSTVKELKTIKDSRLVNFHYLINLKKDNSIANIPCEVLLKKASFLSFKTIVSFPFYDYKRIQLIFPSFPMLGRKNHQKETKASQNNFSNDRLYNLLELLCKCRELLVDDFVKIIILNNNDYHKILKILNQECTLVSANFELKKLLNQFEEPPNDPSLFYPLLSNVPSKDIITLKKEEEELYKDFEKYLCTILELEGTQADIEENLFEELEKVSHGVTKLLIEFDTVLQNNKRINKNLQVFCALSILGTLCPYLLANFTILNTILASAGTAICPNVIADLIMSNLIDNRSSIDEFRKEREIFLAWRLSDPRTKPYFSKHQKGLLSNGV